MGTRACGVSLVSSNPHSKRRNGLKAKAVWLLSPVSYLFPLFSSLHSLYIPSRFCELEKRGMYKPFKAVHESTCATFHTGERIKISPNDPWGTSYETWQTEWKVVRGDASQGKMSTLITPFTWFRRKSCRWATVDNAFWSQWQHSFLGRKEFTSSSLPLPPLCRNQFSWCWCCMIVDIEKHKLCERMFLITTLITISSHGNQGRFMGLLLSAFRGEKISMYLCAPDTHRKLVFETPKWVIF